MILKPNEVCPFMNNCKYHNPTNSNTICQGTNSSRNHEFLCDFRDSQGRLIKEGYIRNTNDITGKMKFIQG